MWSWLLVVRIGCGVIEARFVFSAKGVRDQAEAVRRYAKSVGESLELQNACAEIKLRAERRAGELLGAMERVCKKDNLKRGPKSHNDTSGKPTLSDLNITKSQSSRWQTEASVPDAAFEDLLESVNAAGLELTSALLIQLGRRLANADKLSQLDEAGPFDGKYDSIVIDPPWPRQVASEVRRRTMLFVSEFVL